MFFALNEDGTLRERFKAALEAFPFDLPYEREEDRPNRGVTAHLRENAERWAGLGDRAHYQQTPVADDKVMIIYQPPTPLTPAQEERLANATTYLREQGAMAWAMKSLSDNKPGDGWTLVDAIAFAQERDAPTMFDERRDVGGHASQSAISAIAACVIRFEPPSTADQDWAWGVMARVERMGEPERFSGSRIPWHPTIHLIVALAHDRRSTTPRADTARRLMNLTFHPLEDVAQLAFQALFLDTNEHVRWGTAQLAMDRSLYRQPLVKENGERDNSANRLAREEDLSRALDRLSKATDTPLADLPPAWTRASPRRRGRRRQSEGQMEWGDPDPSFEPQFAAKIFPSFPIEAWCQSSAHRSMLQATLCQLATWTAERLMPPWQDRTRRRDRQTELYEWERVLGDLLARAAPFFETGWVRQHLLAPFLTDDERALRVLAEFADKTATRHVVDASIVPANTFELLNDCVDRILRDRTFDPNSYRAGEVHGYDMPTLITALLFVTVERAPAAARFANGDWSEIGLIMPIVTRLVCAIGWSPFVMEKFLTICERAGVAYPLEEFCNQANAVLDSLANAKGGWTGTMLPARTAGIVQRLADANYPVRLDQAQALLKVLDALIDLGDRRSAALEQTEAFRGVQGRSA